MKPCKSPLDHPSQDSRAFKFELLFKPSYSLLLRQCDFKGNYKKSTAHRIVNISDSWPVIAEKEQLKLRVKRKEILSHESGSDAVTACALLQLNLIPPPALLSLNSDSQSGANKGSQIRRVP
jgi:hypothetical protein